VQAGEKLTIDKYAASNAEITLKKRNIFSMAPGIFGGEQTVKWDASNLFIASSDGKYKGVVYSVILVDLADPNDPHRSLLGDPLGSSDQCAISRIVAVCDVYDAMTEKREYKLAMDKFNVITEMEHGNLGSFHFDYVKILKNIVNKDINPIKLIGTCDMKQETVG
jgi:hypothetical protein